MSDTNTVGLMRNMNQYTPREYPTDTPGEKKARMEGFENGRQYEASLRDGDNPAQLIPAAEFAALDPFDGCECHCFFCGAHKQEVPAHNRDCLWVRCGGKT